jgi:hypothetical protein
VQDIVTAAPEDGLAVIGQRLSVLAQLVAADGPSIIGRAVVGIAGVDRPRVVVDCRFVVMGGKPVVIGFFQLLLGRFGPGGDSVDQADYHRNAKNERGPLFHAIFPHRCPADAGIRRSSITKAAAREPPSSYHDAYYGLLFRRGSERGLLLGMKLKKGGYNAPLVTG